MDRVLRALGVVAVLAAATDFLLLRSIPLVNTDTSFSTIILQGMVATTAFCLCFATGVVGLVATGLRHERKWLVVLAVLTLVAVYARYVLLFGGWEARLYQVAGLGAYQWEQLFIDVLVPLPLPLAVLLYARPRRRSQAVDGDLVVERLRTPSESTNVTE